MPNLRTYFQEKNIYSVDMMLAYINVFGHSVEKVPVEEFLPQLEQNVWGDWSPMTVLEKMDTKKYAENAERIRSADLSYPIIVTGPRKIIVDGYHRLAKAHLEGKKEIKIHNFDTALMKKFVINKDMNFVKVHQQTSIYEILELWSKRFY